MTPIRSTDTEDKTALRGKIDKPVPESTIDKLDRLHKMITEAWAIQAEAELAIQEMEQR